MWKDLVFRAEVIGSSISMMKACWWDDKGELKWGCIGGVFLPFYLPVAGFPTGRPKVIDDG